ncbi:hypothetical protein FACS1894184_05630 [Clostridia bacterium]|nr:hypothetical protein FACS1894184_05630 [Clostridia bacterium]
MTPDNFSSPPPTTNNRAGAMNSDNLENPKATAGDTLTPQLRAAPMAIGPDGLPFRAFTTRCGQSADSTANLEYYRDLIDNAAVKDDIDQYILNFTQPSFTSGETEEVSNPAALVSAMAGVSSNSMKKIVLKQNITLTGTEVASTLGVQNAFVMVCSEPGKHYTIDADGLSRIFSLAGATSANNVYYFTDLTLSGGVAGPLEAGGAISALKQTVLVNNCDFINNERAALTGGKVICINSRFSGNDANGDDTQGDDGGAIDAGNVVAYNSSFYGKRARMTGGAIRATTDYLALIGCDVSYNTADYSDMATYPNGGGIFTSIPYTYIMNTRLTNNSAGTNGGGAYIRGKVGVSSKATFIDCEISYNKATRNNANGGGVYVSENSGANNIVEVDGNTCINNNTAGANGGGFYFYKADDRTNAAFSKDVIFFGNKAIRAYLMTSSTDIAAYNSSVKDTQFSNGLPYGWNNYDIFYTTGTNLSAAYCVPYVYPTKPTGCTLPTCTPTDNLGQLEAAALAPLPEPCLPAGTCFCGWFKDECRAIPVDTTTVFISPDKLYPCFKCNNVRTIYDPAIGSCVSLIGDTGPKGDRGPQGPTGPKGITGPRGPAGEGPDYCELETRIILALTRHGYDLTNTCQPKRRGRFNWCDC